MTTWKLLLVLGLAVGATRCSDLVEHHEKPDLICLVNIYRNISEAVLDKLEVCDHIIICYVGFCGWARHLDGFYDTKRVELIRSRAPDAKIIRQVGIKFDEKFDLDQTVQNIQASMAGGLFDGVELAFDSAHLDQPGQIKYAQFLKLLKRHLDKHLLITNSFVCQHHLPAFLLNAMVEVLDYVILEPSSQNAAAEGNVIAPRVYSDSVANCLLNANFPRNKIVLGLPTGGMLVNASADQASPSYLIPYGNVCELQEQQQRYCEERQYQDCSMFEDGVKLIYDDSNSAGGRALQCVGCKLRGISIALSYDDSAGVCEGKRFPLLDAVQNVFEHRSGVSNFQGCPCGGTYDSEEEEQESESPCHSSEDHQSDSDEEGDCCCENGKPCDGCKLLNRLQGAVKTSEHVVSMSKNVADKVLDTLDRVVALVSYLLGQQSELYESDQEIVGPQPVPSAIPSSLLGLNTALTSALNPKGSDNLPLGLGALNSALPQAPTGLLNAPSAPLSPTTNSHNVSSAQGLIPIVLDTVRKIVNHVNSPPAPSISSVGPASAPTSVVDSILSSIVKPPPGAPNIPAQVPLGLSSPGTVQSAQGTVSKPDVSSIPVPVAPPIISSLLLKRSTNKRTDKTEHLKEADNKHDQTIRLAGKSAKRKIAHRDLGVKGTK